MSAELWVAVLAGAVALAAPLVLAGVGEGLVERAGRLNLGLEGMMIMGALTGVWAASSGGWLVGLLAGAVVGLLMALLMDVLVQRVGADEVVVGLGLTMLGLGLSTFLFQVWVPSGQTNTSVATVPHLPVGGLADVPLLGPVVFGQSLLVGLAVVVLVGAWALLRFTRFGLQVRAVGDDPAASELRGVRTRAVRSAVLLIGGSLGGLAGAAITLGAIGSFTPGVTAGRGWIVLAIVIMGRTRPAGIALGALLFAVLQSFSLLGQSAGLPLPSELTQALPYLVTLAVLVVTSRARLRSAVRRVRTA